MVTLATPLRPAEFVTLQVYVPKSSSPMLATSRVWSVLLIMVEPLVEVRVQTRVRLLLVTEQVRVVDSFTGSLVLVADTLTSGGSVDQR